MSLADDSAARLELLERNDLRRRPPTLDSPIGRQVQIDGRLYLAFSSNDYLGLAHHTDDAGAPAFPKESASLGSGGSRLICGTQRAHRAFEEKLSNYLGVDDAILFSSGYAANLGLLQGLAEAGDLILSDELNHASIIDGCRLSRARTSVFPHLDLAKLESLLAERQEERAFIVIESVFSMDGDEAPLAELRKLADRYNAYLIVDEAHSFGVFGRGGRGLAEEEGCLPDLRILAFGKSLGGSGAAVVGDASTIDLLRHRARSYVFSTAPSPLFVSSLSSSLDRLMAADAEREKLLQLSNKLRRRVADAGYQTSGTRAPIVPILIGENDRALAFDRALRERGFLVQAIRPPTVPKGSARLRIVVSAAHEAEDIDALADALQELRPLLLK